MSFIPLLVMNAILLAIVLLLALADKLLVSYGECQITVTDGDSQQKFTVDGSGMLLSALTEHGVKISSSCGGKGSCGYCKVQVESGAGQLLPTEEIYMSRQEKARGMRLACQVKVKNDITIVIPNYLEVVKELVANNNFDPNKRWLVSIK